MSEDPFRQYLDRLGTLLRLSRRQRAEIREELEDHYEARLGESLRAGVSEEKARAEILRDFGDAAELAQRFGQIGQTRRIVMRSALAASIVVAFTLATSFLMPPDSRNPLAPSAISADSGGESRIDGPLRVVRVEFVDEPKVAESYRLDEIVPAVNFASVPVEEAFASLRKQMELNLVVDWEALAEESIQRDAEVNLQLKDVSLRTVLKLILDQVDQAYGEGPEVGVVENVVVIPSRELPQWETEVRIYDCSGLLPERLAAGRQEQMEMLAKRVVEIVQNRMAATPLNVEALMKAALDVEQHFKFEQLLNVIQATVDPDSWRDNGGSLGTITLFEDSLVIRQTAENHDAIEALLGRLQDIQLAASR